MIETNKLFIGSEDAFFDVESRICYPVDKPDLSHEYNFLLI